LLLASPHGCFVASRRIQVHGCCDIPSSNFWEFVGVHFGPTNGMPFFFCIQPKNPKNATNLKMLLMHVQVLYVRINKNIKF
jgi:hypothetical protein